MDYLHGKRLLAFAGSFMAKLDGFCCVRNISWIPSMGFSAMIIGEDSETEPPSDIGIFVQSNSETEGAVIRLGSVNITVNSPEEILQMPALADRESFWKLVRSKAA